jgi:hypothetical protein
LLERSPGNSKLHQRQTLWRAMPRLSTMANLGKNLLKGKA